MQYRGHVGQCKDHHQRIQHIGTNARSPGNHQRFRMLQQYLFDRRMAGLFFRFQRKKDRRFVNPFTQPQPKDHQQQAEQERNAPAPALELFGADCQSNNGDNAGSHQRTARRSDLGKGCV